MANLGPLFDRLARCREPSGPAAASPAARCARSTTPAPTGCCWSPRTGSPPTTTCCRRRSRTRGGCSPQLSVWWFDQLTPVLDAFGASHHLISADRRSRGDGRPGDAGAAAGDAAGRVRGPRLPVGLGHGRVLAHRLDPRRRRCRPAWSRARGCRRRCSRRRRRRRWASTTRRSTSPPSSSAVGAARAEELRELTLALYSRAAEIALEAGIILADTKFEFGLAGGRAGARRRGAHPRLVPLLAGRPPGRPAPCSPPTTSSTCATG